VPDNVAVVTDAQRHDDFNTKVIEEFRSNAGICGGFFEGKPMVLVTHTGAKSGVRRTTPLVCSTDRDRIVIIASMGGAPTNPAWYHNLVAHPEVTVEHGTETYTARATEVHGDERQRLYDQQAAIMPFFTEYAAKTDRIIPVLVLERVDA
jgi:deazaflavin-dependent oxidoreductase (nitroreductase family)